MKYVVVVVNIIFVLFAAQGVIASSKNMIDGSVSAQYNFAAEKSLSPKLEVLKVELHSIAFNSEKRIAIATLLNNSNVLITPKVGIALFNDAGELIAVADSKKANIFSKKRVETGKKAELLLDFSGHINDFTKVSSVNVVFSVLQRNKEHSAKPSWD